MNVQYLPLIYQQLIWNQGQCLAILDKKSGALCGIRVTNDGSCYCSQKHSNLETGDTREEMVDKMYTSAVVGNEVSDLKSLVSGNIFSDHQRFAANLPAIVQKYRLLIVRDGENSPKVQLMQSQVDSALEYLECLRNLHSLKSNMEDAYGKSGARFISPSATPSSSTVSTPSRSSTASVSSGSSSLSQTARILDPALNAPVINFPPRTPAKRSASDPLPAPSAKRRSDMEILDGEDQIQIIREGGVDNIVDEARSEDSSSTASDREFIDDQSEISEDEILQAELAAEEGLSNGMSGFIEKPASAGIIETLNAFVRRK